MSDNVRPTDTELLDWLEAISSRGEQDGVACGWYVDDAGAPIIYGALEATWSRTLRGAIAYAMETEAWRLRMLDQRAARKVP